MDDYRIQVGDLVQDRITSNTIMDKRAGVVVRIDNPGSIQASYHVIWIGWPGSVPYRDWEIKKYKPDNF